MSANLEAKRDTLRRRLERGWQVIDEAITTGATEEQVTRLIDWWLQLLFQYEAVCRQIASMPIPGAVVAQDAPPPSSGVLAPETPPGGHPPDAEREAVEAWQQMAQEWEEGQA